VTVVARAVGLVVGLLALTTTVVIHEAGHLFAAWACGIPIRRFQVGLGPAVLRFWRGCTRFQLAPLPFWGYVAPYNMRPSELAHFQAAREALRSGRTVPPAPPTRDDEEKQPTMELASRPRRLLFYAGGVVFNLIAAVVLVGVAVTLVLLEPRAAQHVPQESTEEVAPGPGEGEGGLEWIGLNIVENSWDTALVLIASLNIVLAAFNLLPVPPLDGYRCLVVLIGMVIRRDVPKQYLWPLNLLGCLILLLLLGLNAVALIGELVQVLFRQSP
jgi:membrane-associated protease RseP (regulator of RpoE activity)